MPQTYPRFKAAACHIASVFLDADATVDKGISFIREASKAGAALVAFPESFIPGFPVWAALRAPIENHDFFRSLAMQSVRKDGPEVTRLCAAAREHGVYVSTGISEGTDASVGCLWNSNLLIGPDGSIINHHRKLVPTFYEKLIWANGDARGLRVVQTEIGRLGMLICGENTNPLSRYALMAEGEQVHISTYPPIWPTRPPSDNTGYDLRKAIEIRAGAHSFEAKVFNIVSSALADEKLIAAVARDDNSIREIIERSPKSVSMILDPTGSVMSEVISGEEGIVYGEIDTALSVEPKQFHDVVGYYNRFDIYDVKIDRSAREPARYIESLLAQPADAEDQRSGPSAERGRAQ
jgi:aliphatic nitrilase